MTTTETRTQKIWGSRKQGYWVYTGKYGHDRISPVFDTQNEARDWRAGRDKDGIEL